jgi:hypothetical protein
LGRPAVEERRAGAPVPPRLGGPRAGRVTTRLAAFVLTAAALGGCGDLRASTGAFPGSAPSLDVLGAAVLDALARADLETLEGFRLTETEHNREVWPELPAARPEVNFPVELAWSNIDTRDRSSLGRVLPLYEGRSPSHLATECRGEPQRFETFVVLTDCWVVFTMLDDPSNVLEVQLFKDVLLRGGGHKIFRYYDEAPRPMTEAGCAGMFEACHSSTVLR